MSARLWESEWERRAEEGGSESDGGGQRVATETRVRRGGGEKENEHTPMSPKARGVRRERALRGAGTRGGGGFVKAAFVELVRLFAVRGAEALTV